MLGPGNGARRRHDQAAELRPRLTLTSVGNWRRPAHASTARQRRTARRKPCRASNSIVKVKGDDWVTRAPALPLTGEAGPSQP